ncbi:MAG: hypothetical protein A4E28_01255 [Methanocella sp. PtaU1.Bin125]|nr:MAG: hypothetical protein A4E28_01255 [Methanocella sp. PtaU1.Bin125]
MTLSVSINCPSCGGTLSAEEGYVSLSCPYCSSALAIEGDGGIRRLKLTATVDENAAVAATKSWMAGLSMANDLARSSEIAEAYLIYMPFWKLTARVAGWICGYSDERNDNDDGTRRVYRERMLMRDFAWNGTACDPGDLGVKHLPAIEGKALLHEDGSIPTFEVTTSASDATSFGLKAIRITAITSSEIDNLTFAKLHAIPRGIMLVYYPIWIVRYRYMGRLYFATVDGIGGTVLSGRAPGRHFWRSLVLVAGTAVAGFGFAMGLWYVKAMSEQPLFGVAIMLISLIIGAIISGQFFRMSSEVADGALEGGESPFKLKRRIYGITVSDEAAPLQVVAGRKA